jgi:thiamine-phosphate pyrophosphorylase
MLLSYITDRLAFPGDLLSVVGSALRAGVDFVQIREKDLPARALYEVCVEILRLSNPRQTRILVNGRADIALAAGAHGVHLPAGSPSPARLRAIAPQSFVIGVSCHSLEEVRRAKAEDADYAFFGPVFETPSKQAYGPAQGLDRLREMCEAVELPLLALGGVKLDNALLCLQAGAAGIAGISLFQQSSNVEITVRQLRRLEEKLP